MDVLYFLKERTNFIRRFYDGAGEPFRETVRKIEAREPPFVHPAGDDDDEPPFMAEWHDAHEALEILGRTCISMLSASLQLYFKTWEAEMRLSWAPEERKRAFANGFVQGYRVCFGEALNLSWDDCPVNFNILEQVNLARNRDQHPDHISTLRVKYDRKTRENYPDLFFVSDTEKEMFADPEMASVSWMSPTVHVSREALFSAITQVEMLGEWLEERMFAAKYLRVS